MVDQLLSTGTRMDGIADALTVWLPGSTPVYVDRPDPKGSTPFVLLTGNLVPERVSLGGAWSLAELTLAAWSVHNSPAEARALGDLVRTWVLTVMAIPGQIDVEPGRGVGDQWRPDDPGGVHQGREAWAVTLARV